MFRVEPYGRAARATKEIPSTCYNQQFQLSEKKKRKKDNLNSFIVFGAFSVNIHGENRKRDGETGGSGHRDGGGRAEHRDGTGQDRHSRYCTGAVQKRTWEPTHTSPCRCQEAYFLPKSGPMVLTHPSTPLPGASQHPPFGDNACPFSTSPFPRHPQCTVRRGGRGSHKGGCPLTP